MDQKLSPDTVRALLPQRDTHAHKGAFGHLLIVAGSRGMLGAAKLACRAAERSGVGLVTLALPESLANAAAAALTETMLLPLPDLGDGTLAASGLMAALDAARARDAAVVGPGLSRKDESAALARDFIAACPVPLLVDADGLNALAGHTPCLAAREVPTVLTPHPGEMGRLWPDFNSARAESRMDAAARAALEWRGVVVLKGHRTVVAAPDEMPVINTTGNHGLAKGGTGDVLAGLIGGLLAQGMTAFNAACLGVFLHGLAADLLAESGSPRGMVAGDVVETLPAAWRQLEQGS
jgi:NAD(P)H-hydrate epimerase